MKKITLLLIAVLGLSSLVYSQGLSTKTTVYIVRHAEKDIADPKNPDPELSMTGLQRANVLSVKLKKVKFAAVFATNYKRTTQTGNLIAQKNKLTIQFYNPAKPTLLAELVKANYKGQKVLVVGHSNTVLELAEAFGLKRPLAALTDDDYDFLFKVEIDSAGFATLTTQSFGTPHHTSVIQK